MASKPFRKFRFSSEKSPAQSSTAKAMTEIIPSYPPQEASVAGQMLLHDLPQDNTSSMPTASGHTGKPKISRTRFSTYQKAALENAFLSSLYLTCEERDGLAFCIGLHPAIVQTWFKNRRFKWRQKVKNAEGASREHAMSTSSPLLYPRNPPMVNYLICEGPQHQPKEEGLHRLSVIVAPRVRYGSNTHW